MRLLALAVLLSSSVASAEPPTVVEDMAHVLAETNPTPVCERLPRFSEFTLGSSGGIFTRTESRHDDGLAHIQGMGDLPTGRSRWNTGRLAIVGVHADVGREALRLRLPLLDACLRADPYHAEAGTLAFSALVDARGRVTSALGPDNEIGACMRRVVERVVYPVTAPKRVAIAIIVEKR